MQNLEIGKIFSKVKGMVVKVIKMKNMTQQVAQTNMNTLCTMKLIGELEKELSSTK